MSESTSLYTHLNHCKDVQSYMQRASMVAGFHPNKAGAQ